MSRPALFSMFALALLSGCTHVQAFRVIDAESKEPIAGIDSERLETALQASKVPFVLINSMAPVEEQVSDDGGKVKFETGKQFAFNPKSSSRTYGRAFVTVTSFGVKVLYPDEHREVSLAAVNGVVDVPLHSRVYRPKLANIVLPKDMEDRKTDEEFAPSPENP